ncbi:unnamed protein product [Rhizoctonia solani]|uniref:Uncharacterized protein n=1 Tax=Rhizoctonia solani TaxID=456999 RepID=A0A8H3BWF7_9AGAM|nr:unnamed protein product [Rhizoctonia solani]
MKFEFKATDFGPTGTKPQLGGSVNDWVKGLREQKVARMELYNRPKRSLPLVVVVTLVDGSLYLIRRAPNKQGKSPETIVEGIIFMSSRFISRPIIIVTFDFCPDLHDILYICCSVPKFENQDAKVDICSFGLTVLLNTVRHVLKPSNKGSPSPKSSTDPEAQSPVDRFWTDAYKPTQEYDYDLWEGSLLERTKNHARKLIYAAACNAIGQKLNKGGDEFISGAYFTIARVEALASREHSRADMAWKESWVKHTGDLSWVVAWLGNHVRQLSSQTDARDLPHRRFLGEILDKSSLKFVHDGSIRYTYDWDRVTLHSACSPRAPDDHVQQSENQPKSETHTPSEQFLKMTWIWLQSYLPAYIVPECMRSWHHEPRSQPPPQNNDCECPVWVSDWQIAAHSAWGRAWPEAFKAGKDAIPTGVESKQRSTVPSSRPLVESRTRQPHPAALGIMNAWKWTKKRVVRTKPADEGQSTIRSNYQEYKTFFQQRANQSPKIRQRFEKERAAAIQEMSKYKYESLKRALQTIDRQSHLDDIIEQEWQKLVTASRLGDLRRRKFLAKWWKKKLKQRFEVVWLRSWENAWLSVWEDAYRSATSSGIECGVEVKLPTYQSASNPGELLTNSTDSIFYQSLQELFEQGGVDDILNHVRLLFKNLNHVSNLVGVYNPNNSDVKIRALVPDKNQDLQDVSRVLHKQPVSRELSYVELRHFIREEYFKNNLTKHRTSFQNGLSHSWEIIKAFKPDGAEGS